MYVYWGIFILARARDEFLTLKKSLWRDVEKKWLYERFCGSASRSLNTTLAELSDKGHLDACRMVLGECEH